jgi:endogenous inhibitor of DNA gyrase (YacG/DUF329 family)
MCGVFFSRKNSSEGKKHEEELFPFCSRRCIVADIVRGALF